MPSTASFGAAKESWKTPEFVNRRETERQRARANALEKYADAYENARAELSKIYDDGGRLRSQYAIRRGLVHVRPVSRNVQVPSSPAAALAPFKGWALQLYLIAIFDAQSRRPPGSTIENSRPLCRVGRSEAGWADLLPAETKTVDRRAGMRRQAVHALNLLEREHLVAVDGPAGVAGRYDQVRFLDETGEGARNTWLRHYSVPRLDPFVPSNEIVWLPKAFFLNGWVHVLTAAEITTYLMILDLQIRHPDAGDTGVYEVVDQRVDRYGIHRDVYATHRQLSGYGLIRRLDDPNRSQDGRVLRRSSPRYVHQPYRFSTLAGGFDQPALATVKAHLRSPDC